MIGDQLITQDTFIQKKSTIYKFGNIHTSYKCICNNRCDYIKRRLSKGKTVDSKKRRQITVVGFGRTSSLMDLDGKYIWAISNIDIDAAKNLGLTSIKKHWSLAGQVEKEVNGYMGTGFQHLLRL